MGGGLTPRSSSLGSARAEGGNGRRATSSYPLVAEPPFFVRILHSQGKFATSSRRNHHKLPNTLRNSKIKRLTALKKPRQAEEQNGLAALLLYKRSLPFEVPTSAKYTAPLASCNAKRVKEEVAGGKTIFFKSKRRFAHFPLFDREADAFTAASVPRRLHALHRDDDCDSSEADIHNGIARLRKSVAEALHRHHTSSEVSTPTSCRSRDSVDAVRRPRNPFKHRQL